MDLVGLGIMLGSVSGPCKSLPIYDVVLVFVLQEMRRV